MSKEDNSICVVDIDGNVVHKLADTYDVMGIIGNGASYSVLQEAGLEYADLLIAVTKSDEVNLLCCMIAKKEATVTQLPESEILYITKNVIFFRKN